MCAPSWLWVIEPKYSIMDPLVEDTSPSFMTANRRDAQRTFYTQVLTALSGLVLLFLVIYLLAGHADVNKRLKYLSTLSAPAQEEQPADDGLSKLKEALQRFVNESTEAKAAVKAQILKLEQMINSTAGTDTSSLQEELLQQCKNEIQNVTDLLSTKVLQQENRLGRLERTPTQVNHNDSEPSSCSGSKILVGTWGSLQLASQEYHNSKDCGWRVVAPEGSVLAIKFLWFKLEDHDDCNYDWVRLKDPARPSDVVFGKKICGRGDEVKNKLWIVNNNELDVTFHSDTSNTEDGFKLEYQALQIPLSG